MENIRVFEEGGYIHFILRPEELMRLRYSEQSTIAFPRLWTAGSAR